MLFWPFVCYCPHCERRFREEEGAKLPRVIDWHNPTWTAFQRGRERWMKEFAGMLTDAVRRTRPTMTSTHQLSPVLHDWRMAMPYDLTDVCDYASGDFYGPPAQQSLVCKIFEDLSVRKPFEFMTSRCIESVGPRDDEVGFQDGDAGFPRSGLLGGIHVHRRHRSGRNSQSQGL